MSASGSSISSSTQWNHDSVRPPLRASGAATGNVTWASLAAASRTGAPDRAVRNATARAWFSVYMLPSSRGPHLSRSWGTISKSLSGQVGGSRSGVPRTQRSIHLTNSLAIATVYAWPPGSAKYRKRSPRPACSKARPTAAAISSLHAPLNTSSSAPAMSNTGVGMAAASTSVSSYSVMRPVASVSAHGAYTSSTGCKASGTAVHDGPEARIRSSSSVAIMVVAPPPLTPVIPSPWLMSTSSRVAR